MQEFYIYGFKSREDYSKVSSRSYDDERRRIESYLSDYMQFRRTADSKTVYISVDSRTRAHNPFFRAWKAKSFTDGDITLHFIIFDILHDPSVSLTVSQICERIDDTLSGFDEPRTFDVSTVRKKLKEYAEEGLITMQKQGRTVVYSRAEDVPLPPACILDLFTEISPCGVIGSTLLDKLPPHESIFTFKHHYITAAMDSEIIYSFLDALHDGSFVTIRHENGKSAPELFVPLQLMISAQNGRQYLMVYDPVRHQIRSFRTDKAVSVEKAAKCPDLPRYRELYRNARQHMWGISTEGFSPDRIEHIDMTVHFDDDEQHILQRLFREKRCGTVELIDRNTAKFSADVYNVTELVPWLRTFICRIKEIHISDKTAEKRFLDDIDMMYRMYSDDV
ncbi:MAG: WYL domain-containing protein [Oscillospiraceae bacterium]|nr:WYL domain-containing protein [Oscillospiraceae bacterium]